MHTDLLGDERGLAKLCWHKRREGCNKMLTQPICCWDQNFFVILSIVEHVMYLKVVTVILTSIESMYLKVVAGNTN